MRTLLLAAAAALTAGAAYAQAPAAGSTTPTADGPDPNEMICRRVQDSGSRLNASRICMTRQQWIDYQREQRADTERSQNRRAAPR
ncbi:MAG TPA: hypothetical protein VEW04_09330 [Allosphingosinicella sp.]|nr:hypothetical protein [Allosphingosinicella sp.]